MSETNAPGEEIETSRVSRTSRSSTQNEQSSGPARTVPPYANCQFAENALANASGKNIKGSIEQFSKAFAHAKTCKICNDKLGQFLQDIIKELGVKLPTITKIDSDRQPDYAPSPSASISKEVGPGTVGWNAKDSDKGYVLKPTVSSLALTVHELQEKCRLKDAMIEAMADEFRHLGRCQNWSGVHLITNIADVDKISPKVDFDRRALCNYLNARNPHSFLPSEEEEKSYKATNPLGLRVVRQVGPDSILVEWDLPPPGKVIAFEIYVNGLYAQRVHSSTRTKAIIHPVDLSGKIYITLNALSFTGETCENATVPYP